MKRKIYTFQEFITEAYQVILEGKDTGKIKELIKKIKESDPEAIKSLPAYEKVMGWFENEGPTKGKSLVDSDKMVEYLEYWFGDLSSETSNSSRRVVEGMDKLKDTKNVEKILKKCQKEYEKGEFDKYDIGLITKSAEEIGKEFSKLIKSGKEIKREFPEHTTTNPDKYPNRLGIIPFSV